MQPSGPVIPPQAPPPPTAPQPMWEYGGGSPQPPKGGNPAVWLAVCLGIVAIAAVIGLVVVVTNDDDSDGDNAATDSTTSTVATTEEDDVTTTEDDATTTTDDDVTTTGGGGSQNGYTELEHTSFIEGCSAGGLYTEEACECGWQYIVENVSIDEYRETQIQIRTGEIDSEDELPDWINEANEACGLE